MVKLSSKLLILAYNEEENIESTISDTIEYFDEIIVINDKSTDATENILQKISEQNKKIKVVTNNKNMGPGKSMSIGIAKSLESPFDILIKIDGDKQFDNNDIKKLINLGKDNRADFIKCDRFWTGGVKGKIPKIRYFGNAFASLLIKLLTGNQKINDPLNGLFLFSENMANKIIIPKFFNRYGYPFYINAYISMLNIGNNYKLFQYRNKITYGNESSKLNPITVFFKLVVFSFSFFFTTIKKKLRYSTHQLSGLVDILSIFSLLISFFSIYMVFKTRYFEYQGNQGAWLMLFVIFLLTSFILLFQSQKFLKENNKFDFTYLN